MAYNAILDTQLDPDAPITSALGYQLRDNPEAIALGLTGAPRIQSGAYGNLSIPTAAYANGSITTGKIANEAVTRSKLNLTTVTLSGSLAAGSSFSFDPTIYSLFPRINYTDGASVNVTWEDTVIRIRNAQTTGTVNYEITYLRIDD